MGRFAAKVRFRIVAWLRPRARAQEATEELRQHWEREVELLRADGMDEVAARRCATATFGGADGLEAECRDVRGLPWLREAAQDARHALRILAHAPGFTLTAVLTLALGVGANTAVFSMVNGLLLRSLPVAHAARLTVLAFRQGQGPLLEAFSIADYRDIRQQTTDVFNGMAGYEVGFDGLSEQFSGPRGGAAARADRVISNYVTGNYFSLLGLRPQVGRLILPGEGRTPGADPIVVLSYDYWRSRFAGSAAVVGRSVQINGQSLTVVGVAPKGFEGLNAWVSPQVYLPLGMQTLESNPPDFMQNRVLQNLLVVGSLKPGLELAPAQAELNLVARRLATAYPASDRGMAMQLYWERQARPDPVSAAMLWRGGELFWGLVGLVLLLACANVGGILAVRGASRARELSLRVALGARPSRLVRQLLTENLLLALAGGAAGLLIGEAASRIAESLSLHLGTGGPVAFHLDARVFAYAFAVSLAAGLLAGLPPALRAVRGAPGAGVAAGGRITRGGARWRAGLVVAQVAISLTLLVMAGLFTKSLVRARQAPLGFDATHVQLWTMDPGEVGAGPAQGLALYHRLLARAQALPQVESAGLGASVPLGTFANNDYLKIARYRNPPGQGLPLVFYNVVSPTYLSTLRIPVLQGRGFTAADRQGSLPVALVNQAFAARYWPGLDPIGQVFAKVSGITNPSYQVVGVVQNSHFRSLSGTPAPFFYLPLEQNYDLSSQQTLVLRSPAPPSVLRREVASMAHDLAPGLPLFDVHSLTSAMDSPRGWLLYQLGAGLSAVLAGLGLLLAGLGVYGVIAHAAAQRSQEIAVRLALGARPTHILGMLLGQGLAVVGVGLLLGLLAASAAGHAAANLLHGVSASDPVVFVGVSAFLLLAAAAACYVPARRAMATDPALVLRRD